MGVNFSHVAADCPECGEPMPRLPAEFLMEGTPPYWCCHIKPVLSFHPPPPVRRWFWDFTYTFPLNRFRIEITA